MRITLPVGIILDGQRYREVEVGYLTGHALKSMRAAIGGRRPQGLDHYLDALKVGIKGIVGYEGTITPEIIKNMFWVDAEYILHSMAVMELEALRDIDPSVGEPTISRTCPSCGHTSDFPVDLAGRAVRMVEETKFGESSDFTIPFKLSQPIDWLDPEKTPYQEGRLGLHTVGDFLEIARRAARNVGEATLYSICRAIVELGPKGRGEIDPADLEPLPAVDIKRLERLYNDNEPGLLPLEPAECPNCGNEVNLNPIDYVLDFLLVSR